MNSRELIVIANPHSGRRASREIAQQIAALLEPAGFRIRIVETEAAGHAVDLARELPLDECEALGVIGGDGTLHEVLNGLMARQSKHRVPLALFPGGTGNTVMEHLGCSDAASVVNHLLQRHYLDIDVIKVSMQDHVEYCCNIVGWGAVTDINRTAECFRWLGKHRYTLATLWHLVSPPIHRARIRLDGVENDRELLFLVACNTQCTGRGMRIAPNARIDDGKLDVVMAKSSTPAKLLSLFRRVFDGSHLGSDIVECIQVREFAIWTAQPMGLNLDGELRGSTPCQVQVLPRSLTVVAAPTENGSLTTS